MPNQHTGATDLATRFWSKALKSDGCWFWTSATVAGYGVFTISGGRPHGRLFKAHRIAWELTYGDIPDGLIVCHTCDVKRCVRPEHLFLGSNADNSADMVAKGRSARGDKNPIHVNPQLRQGVNNGRARLTEADVRAIRDQYAAGATQIALAHKFGVPQTHISGITRRRSWAHVA